MCRIVNVEELGTEGYVTIKDGKNKIVAFDCENKFQLGTEIDTILKAILVSNVVRTDDFDKQEHISQLDNGAQHVCGILEDRICGIIRVGKIRICISDYIPRDINEGDSIEFDVGRIDLYD